MADRELTPAQKKEIKRFERLEGAEATVRWDRTHLPTYYGERDTDCVVRFLGGWYVLGAEGDTKLILSRSRVC